MEKSREWNDSKENIYEVMGIDNETRLRMLDTVTAGLLDDSTYTKTLKTILSRSTCIEEALFGALQLGFAAGKLMF